MHIQTCMLLCMYVCILTIELLTALVNACPTSLAAESKALSKFDCIKLIIRQCSSVFVSVCVFINSQRGLRR